MSSKYVDTESSIQVIGCIYSNPELLNNDKYTFTEDDFVPELHKVIFSAMNNLYFTGGNEKFSRQTVEDYISKFPESLAIYKAQNGREWLENAYHSANVTNFNFYASRVKKMTLLREYEKVGMDVSYILDPDEVDPKIRQKKEELFNGMTLKELADNVENKVLRVKDDVVEDNDNLEWHAGDNSKQILEDIVNGKNLGYPFYDPVYTAITGGARRGKMILRSAASGVGKAILNDEIIPTPSGWRKVSDIKVGDYLFDAFGKPTKVIGVFPQGKKDVWQVSFSDGRSAKCSPDHLWSYCTHGQKPYSIAARKFYTKTLREISQDKQYRNHSIMVPQQMAVQYPHKVLPIDPYVMGLILGDGSFRIQKNANNKTFSYSSEDEELPNAIAQIMGWGVKKNSSHNYNWTFKWKDKNDSRKHKSGYGTEHVNVWVEEILDAYPSLWNVKSEDKFIPTEYLQGDIQQRYDILNGLLDSDGSVDKKGRVRYYTISPMLRDNVIEICESLGLHARYSVDNHKPTNTGYIIHITGSPDVKLKLFRLKRKHALMEQWYNNGEKKFHGNFVRIDNIKDLGYQTEMTCFLVDNPEHLFLMNDFIVTHNTRTSVADACYLACDEIYENGQWQDIGDRIPTLLISVEVDEDELEALMLSFIANVPSNHIMENKFEMGEYDRVVHAIDIEKRSKLHIVFMPDYKLKDVRNAIVKGIREYGVQVIFFDYICSSTSIMAELASATGGVKLNEFQVLYNMASSLKDIAENFGVTIVTSSQLNRSAMDTLTPTSNVLAGASSMANRVDTAMAMRDVTKEDLKEIGDYFEEGFEPNVVGGVFKNRSGKWNNIVLYYAADKGTCRYRVVFATDYLMRPIPLEKILPKEEQDTVF